MGACRILIVEDELLIASDIELTLSRAGHHVVGIVNDFTGAISLAEESRPDLALMDIALQGHRSGIEAALTLRERWSIPVVFLTANTDEATLARARAAGAYGFLTKPFRSEELLETVRIAIEQHKRTEHLFASAKWLTTIMDSLTDAVIATDASGLVRYLNPAAEGLTGWTPGAAVGRAIEEVYPLSDMAGKPLEVCLLRQALTSGEYKGRAHFRLRQRSGESLLIEDSATPILQNGKVIGAVTVFLDISQRLELERHRELERDRLEEQAHSVAEALGQTRSELRALAANLMSTQEQERSRIARELHDDIGQQVAILNIMMDQAEGMPGLAAPFVSDLRRHARSLAQSVREISHQLHPTVIQDLGLSAALESLVDRERLLGRSVSFTAQPLPSVIPLQKATALFRIAQEALQNAAKYAPGAPVRVGLSNGDNALQLRIRDDGPGFSLVESRSRGGLGLISMQERARLAGGTLFLSTRPGQGTLLLVRVPVGEGDDVDPDASRDRRGSFADAADDPQPA